MKTRIISALVGIPIVLLLLFLSGTWMFACFVTLVATLALHEYLRLCGVGGIIAWPTLILGGFVLLAVPAGLLQVVPIVVLSAMLLPAIFRVGNPAARFRDLTESLLGLVFIGYAMGCLLLLRMLPSGNAWVLLILAATWAGDSAAYFVGSRYGRRQLASILSPKKTWAGAVGGLGGSLLGGLAVLPVFLGGVSPAFLVAVSLAVGVAGQLGDLFESLWKRAKSVKDSGTIIPGHGGILDRIDSLLVGIPVGYHILRTWGS